MRRLPRCGPSVPVRRPPAVTRPFASIPGRDWRTLAYQPGAQWKPRLDERVAIWLAKQKRSMDADGLPVSEADLLKGSRRAFYVVSELMNPLLEKKDVPGDDQLRMLFTNVMVRWFHEYRAEYSLEARRARKEQEERQAEEDEDDDDVLPVEDEMPVLWESKHEVMDVALLRWEENQGIVKYTTAARYPHPISGRMLFDHLWLFKYAVPRGATTNEKHFLLHEIVWPEL